MSTHSDLLDFDSVYAGSPPSPSVLYETKELEEAEDEYAGPPQENPESTLPGSDASTTARPVETVTSLESNASLMDVDRTDSDVNMPTHPNTSGEDLQGTAAAQGLPAQVIPFQNPMYSRNKKGEIIQIPDSTDFGPRFHQSLGRLYTKLAPFSKDHRGGKTTIWSPRMRERKTEEVLQSVMDDFKAVVHDMFRDRNITLKDGPAPVDVATNMPEDTSDRCLCRKQHDVIFQCPIDGHKHIDICKKAIQSSGSSSSSSQTRSEPPPTPSPKVPTPVPSPRREPSPLPSTSRQSRDPMPPPFRGRGRGRGRQNRSRSGWRESFKDRQRREDSELEATERKLEYLRARRSQSSSSSSRNTYENPPKRHTAQDRLVPKITTPTNHPTPDQFKRLMSVAGSLAQTSAPAPTLMSPPVVATSTLAPAPKPRPPPLFPGLGVGFVPVPAQHGDPVVLGSDGLPDYRYRPQRPTSLPTNVVFEVTIVEGKWHVSTRN
jgi:hypothetical protein